MPAKHPEGCLVLSKWPIIVRFCNYYSDGLLGTYKAPFPTQPPAPSPHSKRLELKQLRGRSLTCAEQWGFVPTPSQTGSNNRHPVRGETCPPVWKLRVHGDNQS